MSGNISISVIICTYNPSEFLSRTIESLLNQSIPRNSYEIIVVDDGSEYNISEIIAPYKEELKTITLNSNKGLGNARREGILASTGEFIAFTDDDCIVDTKWLEKILEGFDKFRNADGIGGKILPYSEDSLLECYAYRSKNTLYSHIPKSSGKGRIINYGKKFFAANQQVFTDGQSLDSIMGLNSSYRRSSLVKVRNTNPNLRRGVDWDLNTRLKKIGARLYYKDDAIVFHKHRTTFKSFFRHIYAYGRAYVHIADQHKEIALLPYPFPIVFILATVGLSYSILFFPQLASMFSILGLSIILLYFFTNIATSLRVVKNNRCLSCIFFFPIIDFLREMVYDIAIFKTFIELRLSKRKKDINKIAL
ncbi:MAG: glycosyltransferase [Candidatus Odinarchaeota archaeon]